MKNQRITKNTKIALIVFTLLILLLFFVGTSYKLFEKWSWYDELAHIIGGAWIGLIIIGLYKKYKSKIPLFEYFSSHPVKTVISFMIVIGLGWEVFESILVYTLKTTYGTAPELQPSHFDTLTDLLTAILGSATSAYITKK